jgi:protein-S-isoprenylcysteine O-methyltransferase Ste14
MQNRANRPLTERAIKATLEFLATLWVLIFVPVWSLSYWQGWLLWLHVCTWCGALTLYFARHDPALLERRLSAGPAAEREPSQKRIQAFAAVAAISILVVSVLDHRFGWSAVPAGAVLLGNALVVLGFLAVFVVLRANTFASAIVEVTPGQRVVSSGPYAVVRHPMYSGALLLFSGIPLALGSWWGLAGVAAMAGVLVARLLDEERYLVRHLPGYDDYRREVRWRLLPGVW